jgi:hypothetical protein
MRSYQKYLTVLFCLSFALAVMAFIKKRQLPRVSEILNPLQQDPVQAVTRELPFSFNYQGGAYEVQPMADYVLHGLVVSHNNITELGDIYHDKHSLDTKDLCVVWGDNIRSDDFRRVKFRSGPWTCYCRYPEGVKFRMDQFSNNHLITSEESIRNKIARVGWGDQIKISGLLVNYRERAWPAGEWRKTSLIRTDDWNGACEVIYVKSIDILKAQNHAWIFLYRWAIYGLFIFPIMKLGLFLFGTRPALPYHD